MQYTDSLRSQNISINCNEYSKVSILSQSSESLFISWREKMVQQVVITTSMFFKCKCQIITSSSCVPVSVEFKCKCQITLYAANRKWTIQSKKVKPFNTASQRKEVAGKHITFEQHNPCKGCGACSNAWMSYRHDNNFCNQYYTFNA